MLNAPHTAALTAHQLSKSYNLEPILQEVTFSINRGERVGLIGPNGSGKTTLLRMLSGELLPDSGYVALAPADLRVGYLAQGFEPDPALTVSEMLGQAVGDPRALEAQLAELATAMVERPDDNALQQAFDRALQRLNSAEPGRAQRTLAALGLEDVPQTRPAGLLSGGQKTRLSLAMLLLQEPELLLLDEPTNHLDVAMIEWLEVWLDGFPGGALIVSHDRAFLDRTVHKILDLDPHSHTIREYAGGYSAYLDQALKERDRQWAAWRNQEVEIRRMHQDIKRTMEQARWVERTTTPRTPGVRRYAKKVARKGKSREKKLERYLDADERVEKPARSWQMNLAFGEARLGQDVLSLEELTVGYAGQAPLLENLSLEVQAGQRVVVTGPNGSGKTTLLRTLAGQLAPLAGRARLGSSVQLGYMSQEQNGLEAQQTALEIIQRAAPLSETEARSFLHFFLFSGDDPLRAAHSLSFGERARLELARLVAQGCNFLLLDEPINHLDIPSRTRFEQALTHFEGAVLAVVHDRYFIERFATDLWLVQGGGIEQRILR